MTSRNTLGPEFDEDEEELSLRWMLQLHSTLQLLSFEGVVIARVDRLEGFFTVRSVNHIWRKPRR